MNRSFLILLMVLFMGCKPCKEVSTLVYDTDTMIIYHDSIVMLPADSSLVNALFQCDSLNNVVLSELETVKGRKIKPIVEFKDRWFKVIIPVDSEAVVLKWKEKHTSNIKEKEVIKTEIVKVKPKWLVNLAWMGGLALLYVIGVIISKIVKLIKPL